MQIWRLTHLAESYLLVQVQRCECADDEPLRSGERPFARVVTTTDDTLQQKQGRKRRITQLLRVSILRVQEERTC